MSRSRGVLTVFGLKGGIPMASITQAFFNRLGRLRAWFRLKTAAFELNLGLSLNNQDQDQDP